jgi:integrase
VFSVGIPGGCWQLLNITETRLHHKMHDTPATANRVLAVLHKMFELAEAWGIGPETSNPCRRIQKYKEIACERFLSTDELQRLGVALAEAERDSEHPSAIAAIRLLLTGARRSEVLTLEWSFIDFEHGYMRLPDSKIGPKTIHLGPPALDLLASLPRFSGPGDTHGEGRCRSFCWTLPHLAAHPGARRHR